MAEIQGGNLYEINKGLVEKTSKKLKGKALNNKVHNELMPFIQNTIENEKYYMLLCHDKRDYTIFHILRPFDKNGKCQKVSDELIECLHNRGSIFAIDQTEDKAAVEIWLNYNDEEIVCYYFFPYSQAVLDV